MGLLSVPLKTILPYHADLQNESIPESYALCNGQTLDSTQQDVIPNGSYTLPDLRNVFLLGADISKAASISGDTSNGPSGAPGPKGIGGAHSKSLIVAELASHSHGGTITNAGVHTHAGSTTDTGGAHVHSATTTTAGAHAHAGSSTNSTGSHSHNGSTTSLAGDHSHSVTDPGHIHASYQGGNINQPLVGHSGYAMGGQAVTSSTFNVTSTTGISIVNNGNHQHTLTITSDGNHTHTLTITSDGDHTHPITVASGGSHSHNVTLLPDGDHTHAFTGNNTGSGQAWDTRPRFYGVVYIMKVKN